MNRARRYYWAVVVPAVAEHRGDVDYRSVHEAIAHELVPAGDDPEGGYQYFSTSVSGMSDTQFSQYLDRVLVWATLAGIDVPPPRGRDE